jgi:hypothetical protein
MSTAHTTTNPMDANARGNKMTSTMVFLFEMAYVLAMSNPKSI